LIKCLCDLTSLFDENAPRLTVRGCPIGLARALLYEDREAEAQTVNQSGGQTMKRFLTSAALCLALGLGLTTHDSLAAQNKNAGKPPAKTSAHAEAVKKCNDDYKEATKKANDDYATAVKDAKTKKGKEKSDATKAASKAKSDALAAAKKSKTDCLSAAPK
jgi:hypothetical protein